MDEPVITGRTTRPLDDVVGEALTARVTVDEHGTVTGWNAGAEQLLGYSAQQIVGRPAAELPAGPLPPDLPRSPGCRDGTARSRSDTATADGWRSRSSPTTGPANGSWCRP